MLPSRLRQEQKPASIQTADKEVQIYALGKDATMVRWFTGMPAGVGVGRSPLDCDNMFAPARRVNIKVQVMEIENTTFGTITIGGKTMNTMWSSAFPGKL